MCLISYDPVTRCAPALTSSHIPIVTSSGPWYRTQPLPCSQATLLPLQVNLMRDDPYSLQHDAEEQASRNFFDLEAVKDSPQSLGGGILAHDA